MVLSVGGSSPPTPVDVGCCFEGSLMVVVTVLEVVLVMVIGVCDSCSRDRSGDNCSIGRIEMLSHV